MLGSDSQIEPCSITGDDLLPVRSLILGTQVLWDGYLQKLLCEWCRVHKDLVEDEVHQVGHEACAMLKKAKEIFGLDFYMHVKH